MSNSSDASTDDEILPHEKKKRKPSWREIEHARLILLIADSDTRRGVTLSPQDYETVKRARALIEQWGNQ